MPSARNPDPDQGKRCKREHHEARQGEAGHPCRIRRTVLPHDSRGRGQAGIAARYARYSTPAHTAIAMTMPADSRSLTIPPIALGNNCEGSVTCGIAPPSLIMCHRRRNCHRGSPPPNRRGAAGVRAPPESARCGSTAASLTACVMLGVIPDCVGLDPGDDRDIGIEGAYAGLSGRSPLRTPSHANRRDSSSVRIAAVWRPNERSAPGDREGPGPACRDRMDSRFDADRGICSRFVLGRERPDRQTFHDRGRCRLRGVGLRVGPHLLFVVAIVKRRYGVASFATLVPAVAFYVVATGGSNNADFFGSVPSLDAAVTATVITAACTVAIFVALFLTGPGGRAVSPPTPGDPPSPRT